MTLWTVFNDQSCFPFWGGLMTPRCKRHMNQIFPTVGYMNFAFFHHLLLSQSPINLLITIITNIIIIISSAASLNLWCISLDFISSALSPHHHHNHQEQHVWIFDVSPLIVSLLPTGWWPWEGNWYLESSCVLQCTRMVFNIHQDIHDFEDDHWLWHWDRARASFYSFSSNNSRELIS